MRKITKILLFAVLAIPFLQSCNSKFEQADKAVLVTVQKSLDPAGFYGILDSGEKLYPGSMRVAYTPSKDIQRAIIYFSELEEPREGYAYNADVFNVAEVETQRITQVISPQADTLVNGLQINNAWIGGGFINVEFSVNIDRFSTKSLSVALQEMMIDGRAELDEEGYFPLTLGFKCYPALENGMGTTISTMASFYLGNGYSMDELGCKGYKIIYNGLNSYLGEEKKTLIVKPQANNQ